MEVLALLLIIFLLFVLVSLKNNVSADFKELNKKFDTLSQQITLLTSQQAQSNVGRKEVEKTPPQKIDPVIVKPTPKEETVDYFRHHEIQAERTVAPVQQNIKPKVESSQKVFEDTPPPAAQPGFFDRNPDLEKFIGENLANKIGIAILVIGIGFFVKYAIDQNWINEIGRVFIGVLCGGILLGIAHKLRKTFTAFSSVLVGGGIAVLYFTIAIAFHEYHIFSQAAAFILMVAITGFTIVLALGYNKVELAVLAILGGFGSPFMISTGEGNYIILFTYIAILNLGMLILAYYKKWKIVNIVCYVFTILIFASWLASRFDNKNVSMIFGSLSFATILYIIFFVMNIINNIKERTKFEAVEILMLLSNTFLYYSAGMLILNNDIGIDYKGLFTTLLAVFNFTFAYVLYKNQRVDRNLVFMLIGLVLTFISLAAPIQLEGNYITLFWAAEGVLLLWLSQKSGIKLIKVGSVVVMILMMISLLIDWAQIYIDVEPNIHYSIVFNKGYITSLVALASLIVTYFLLRNETEESLLPVKEFKAGIIIVCCILTYTANLLELNHQLIYYVDSFTARIIIIGTYNMFVVLILLLLENRVNISAGIKRLSTVLVLLAIAAYFVYYHSMIVSSRIEFLGGVSTSTGFIFHYILTGLLVADAVISLRRLNADAAFVKSINNLHWWLYIFLFVFIISAELDHIVLLTTYQTSVSATSLLKDTHKIGFPILWGLISFVLIALGLKRKVKMLRVIALVLLLITLLKLFIIDLRGISEGGKIAAFISLGILLLVVSFMYQRLKRLLLEDTPKQENL